MAAVCKIHHPDKLPKGTRYKPGKLQGDLKPGPKKDLKTDKYDIQSEQPETPRKVFDIFHKYVAMMK